MVLEGLVRTPRTLEGTWKQRDGVLDLHALLAELVGRDPREGAELFHGTLIAALADWVGRAAAKTGVREVVLSGGCLLNQVLASGLVRELERAGSPDAERASEAHLLQLLEQMW